MIFEIDSVPIKLQVYLYNVLIYNKLTLAAKYLIIFVKNIKYYQMKRFTILSCKSTLITESHIKNLIFLANIDGFFHEKEKQYLNDLASQYGVKNAKLEKIQADKKYVEFKVPKSEKQKLQHLYELTKMMLADGKIHPKEAELCYLYACDYGFQPESINDMLTQLIQSAEKGYSTEEAIAQQIGAF